MELNRAVAGLAALAEPTRLGVYRQLVRHAPVGCCVGDLLPETGLAQPTLSFHLKALTHAGLVTRTKRGRHVFYAPDFDAMHALMAYLMENCCAGAQCLDTLTRCCEDAQS